MIPLRTFWFNISEFLDGFSHFLSIQFKKVLIECGLSAGLVEKQQYLADK
jgi:hypothetical protein